MNDSNDSPQDEGGGHATDSEPATIIERYIAGSDNGRDQIAAEHPALIADKITEQAEQTRREPQRTWTEVGAPYTTPGRRPDVLRAIASLEWHRIGRAEPLWAPTSPGLAINASIRELALPCVQEIAWHGSASAVDWYDEDKVEGEHYTIYGIQAKYQNVRVRLYLIDTGSATVPLATDFWPAEGDGKVSA